MQEKIGRTAGVDVVDGGTPLLGKKRCYYGLVVGFTMICNAMQCIHTRQLIPASDRSPCSPRAGVGSTPKTTSVPH